jgi:hypothetical protein
MGLPFGLGHPRILAADRRWRPIVKKRTRLEFKPIAVRIDEARAMSGGISRDEIYRAIGRGELEAVKDGRRTLITVASLEARIRRLPRADIRALVPSRPAVKRSRKAAGKRRTGRRRAAKTATTVGP